MLRSIAILASIGLVIGFMYSRGLISLSRKVSAVYVGAVGGKGARFTSCSGTIRRRVRFRESRLYAFALNAEITKGNIEVELVTREGESVFCLTPAQSAVSAVMDSGKWYTLIYRFSFASGSFEIDWK